MVVNSKKYWSFLKGRRHQKIRKEEVKSSNSKVFVCLKSVTFYNNVYIPILKVDCIDILAPLSACTFDKKLEDNKIRKLVKLKCRE